LDDFFLVFPALGWSIWNDKDGLRRRAAQEVSRRVGDRIQGVSQRHVAQIERDRRVAERGIEGDADIPEPRDDLEDLTAACLSEHEAGGHLDVRWQIQPWRR